MRVEDRAREARELAGRHNLYDSGDDLASQAASMPPNPSGGGRAQQDLLQPRDGESGDLRERLRIQRALERLADAVVDEHGGDDLTKPQGNERTACVVSQPGIIGAADQ